MQAIVTIAGSQYNVRKDDTIIVARLEQDENSTVEFNDIVMTIDGSNITSGGGSVKATVLEHGRDSKVLVFHKKRRKGYQKLNGHRQQYTKIQITDITA